MKVAAALAKHNIPLAFADELTPLFHDIFPDSEIAKHYSSRRGKTACIINGAIAPYLEEQIMVAHPFSVAIDGSSDSGVEKMNPLTVRIFDCNGGQVCTQFLDLCMSSVSTAEGIFGKMQDALSRCGITWQNCVGVALDNSVSHQLSTIFCTLHHISLTDGRQSLKQQP